MIKLTHPELKIKASSTLNRSSKYAPKFIFDGNTDTCWNSDQGLPQYITINFEKIIIPTSLSFTFNGGFVGNNVNIEISLDSINYITILDSICFDDTNDKQTIELPSNNHSDTIQGQYLKINFLSSTDFYGRITLYSLDIYGTEV